MNFDIQNYLVTFLILVGVLVTFGSAAYSIGSEYEGITGTQINSSFSSTYNRLDVITGETKQIEEKLSGGDLGNEDANSDFLGSAYASGKIVFGSFGAVAAMVNDSVTALHIPVIWAVIATTLITILVLTSILFMIFGGNGK